MMGMSGHISAGPIWACVRVDDYCDPSVAGTLTRVKTIETCVESVLATVSGRFAIAHRFFYFGEDD